MSVGTNIKKLRLEKEMTQEELATAANVSRVMIAQIERDSRCPTVILGKTIAITAKHIEPDSTPCDAVAMTP